MSDLRRSRWMIVMKRGRKKETGTSRWSLRVADVETNVVHGCLGLVITLDTGHSLLFVLALIIRRRRNGKKRILFTFVSGKVSSMQSHSVAQDSLGSIEFRLSKPASLTTLLSTPEKSSEFAQRCPLFGVSVSLSSYDL
jgi:hypothetical protein